MSDEGHSQVEAGHLSLPGGAGGEASGLREVMDVRFSRNLHFDWYAAHGTRPRMFRRLIKGLEADARRLEADECIWYRRSENGKLVEVELSLRRYRSSRRCLITAEEFALLREHPLIGARLSARGEGTP